MCSSSSSLLRNQCSLILIFEILLDVNIFNNNFFVIWACYVIMFSDWDYKTEFWWSNIEREGDTYQIKQGEMEREREMRTKHSERERDRENIWHETEEEDEGYCLVEEKWIERIMVISLEFDRARGFFVRSPKGGTKI